MSFFSKKPPGAAWQRDLKRLACHDCGGAQHPLRLFADCGHSRSVGAYYDASTGLLRLQCPKCFRVAVTIEVRP